MVGVGSGALAGESQWVRTSQLVRHVRAAHGRACLRRGRRRDVVVHELPVTERATVLRAYLDAARERGGERSAARQATFYLGVDLDAMEDQLAVPAGPAARVAPLRPG